MPPKRKFTARKVSGDSQAELDVSAAANPKRLREQLFETDEPTFETQPAQRRSSRAGKGRGGAVQQLENIERVQASRPSRQAARSLDLAMQGQVINSMAPSYAPAEDNNADSQIPPWAASTAPLTQVQPAFTPSQSDTSFGFKIPASTATSTRTMGSPGHDALPRPPSTVSTSSFASSRGPSLLLAGLARTTSTAPTSRTPSECGSNHEYSTIDDVYRELRCQDQELTEDALGLAPQRIGLHRTDSFRQIPLAFPRTHSMLVTGDEPETTQDGHIRSGSLEIDEASPDEDERIAMSALRGQRLPTSSSQPRVLTTDEGRDGQGGQPVASSRHNHASVSEDVAEHYQRNCPFRRADSRSLTVAEPNIEDGRQPTAPDSHPESEADDVVARHRQRNPPPCLPDNARLLAARNQQTLQRLRSVSRATSSDELLAPISVQPQIAPAATGPPQTQSVPASASALVTPTAAAGSVASGNQPGHTDLSQLHHYPPAIRDVIERAKQFSHCNLGSVNSFPLRLQFNSKAVEYMDEAGAECRARGLTIPEGWWPQYTNGITKLLWEDIGNWRSALKKKARSFVRQAYDWDPQNRQPVNVDIARTLLDGGSFLMNGLDEDGRTNNLAHPALAGLIVDFFYTGSNAMGNLFPEVFGAEVPRPAVALAATAIKLALDEIVAEGKEVTFKRDVYTDVYLDILRLMTKCDTAPVHRAKTKVLRIQWAKMGRYGNGSSAGSMTGFDVTLD